ncbi:MAG: hypothetical protein WC379_14800 [Methanoregula sp.]|jgi:hypothetical protein
MENYTLWKSSFHDQFSPHCASPVGGCIAIPLHYPYRQYGNIANGFCHSGGNVTSGSVKDFRIISPEQNQQFCISVMDDFIDFHPLCQSKYADFENIKKHFLACSG